MKMKLVLLSMVVIVSIIFGSACGDSVYSKYYEDCRYQIRTANSYYLTDNYTTEGNFVVMYKYITSKNELKDVWVGKIMIPINTIKSIEDY